MAKIGLLSAISFMLMFFELQLPIFPSFLKLDLSELPVVIGAMALGPMAGVCIELVKDLLNLTKTTSGGIGEIANFVMGCALVIPIGAVYKKYRTNAGYIAGAVAGTALMIVAGCVLNYYVLIPMYTKFMPVEAIIEMARIINGAVVDMKTLVLFTIAPFNLLKGACISVIGYVMFVALKPMLMRSARSANA